MLLRGLLIFITLILSTFTTAVPTPNEGSMTKEIKSPSSFNDISNHPIWASIREIAERPTTNTHTEIEMLIKGTFLDPEVITANKSSDNPIAQGLQCETSEVSPYYFDSLILVSILHGRSNWNEPAHNPGGTCTPHPSWNTAEFAICSDVYISMSWKEFGDLGYSIAVNCMQYHGTWRSGGKYEWVGGRDVRVYWHKLSKPE
ncbi:hypothetical protein HOY80DRAFT_981607 [Tuber brumale]|nr:hypothetical protein HOY80DRAFT_981607 [Tuber brumale]